MRATLADSSVKIIEILPPLVESQLHDHQGMSEKLSKFWMPLKDFTKEVMQGLRCVRAAL
jgi:short-subunit dehydrogenase involved in D-alanine esterification of teichoic acids